MFLALCLCRFSSSFPCCLCWCSYCEYSEPMNPWEYSEESDIISIGVCIIDPKESLLMYPGLLWLALDLSPLQRKSLRTYNTVVVKNCESTKININNSMPAMRGNKHKNPKPAVKSSSPKKFHSNRTLIEGSTPWAASTSVGRVSI